MEARDAAREADAMQVVDVREDFEWEAGHIDGAVHIPLAQLPSRLNELDRSQPVLAVCHVGQRSAMATAYLRERGFDSHNLEGGIDAWTAEGLPLAD